MLVGTSSSTSLSVALEHGLPRQAQTPPAQQVPVPPPPVLEVAPGGRAEDVDSVENRRESESDDDAQLNNLFLENNLPVFLEGEHFALDRRRRWSGISSSSLSVAPEQGLPFYQAAQAARGPQILVPVGRRRTTSLALPETIGPTENLRNTGRTPAQEGTTEGAAETPKTSTTTPRPDGGLDLDSIELGSLGGRGPLSPTGPGRTATGATDEDYAIPFGGAVHTFSPPTPIVVPSSTYFFPCMSGLASLTYLPRMCICSCHSFVMLCREMLCRDIRRR